MRMSIALDDQHCKLTSAGHLWWGGQHTAAPDVAQLNASPCPKVEKSPPHHRGRRKTHFLCGQHSFLRCGRPWPERFLKALYNIQSDDCTLHLGMCVCSKAAKDNLERRIRSMFETWDENGDGLISAKDWSITWQIQGSVLPEQWQRFSYWNLPVEKAECVLPSVAVTRSLLTPAASHQQVAPFLHRSRRMFCHCQRLARTLTWTDAVEPLLSSQWFPSTRGVIWSKSLSLLHYFFTAVRSARITRRTEDMQERKNFKKCKKSKAKPWEHRNFLISSTQIKRTIDEQSIQDQNHTKPKNATCQQNNNKKNCKNVKAKPSSCWQLSGSNVLHRYWDTCDRKVSKLRFQVCNFLKPRLLWCWVNVQTTPPMPKPWHKEFCIVNAFLASVWDTLSFVVDLALYNMCFKTSTSLWPFSKHQFLCFLFIVLIFVALLVLQQRREKAKCRQPLKITNVQLSLKFSNSSLHNLCLPEKTRNSIMIGYIFSS